MKHIKLPIAWSTIPTESFMNDFYNTILTLESELLDNEYIGIHCTHGVNRTGYMIVRYLCERKGLTHD